MVTIGRKIMIYTYLERKKKHKFIVLAVHHYLSISPTSYVGDVLLSGNASSH